MMTPRETTTRPGTVTGAARAKGQHAEPAAPGWPRVVLRVAGSSLLLATGAIPLDPYLTGYQTIPVIGRLLLLRAITAVGLERAVLVIPRQRIAPMAPRLGAAA